MRYRPWCMLLLASVLWLSSALPAQAERTSAHPATGALVAPLEPLEAEILAFMAAHDIPGAVFALSRNGELLAQRGYGWKDRDRTESMPADARMRIASITKPVVAAAVHALVRDNVLSMDDRVFRLGQSGAGILPVEPYPQMSDARIARITVRQLLDHTAGWDRSEVGDLTYREVQVSRAMGLAGTPGRENLLNYILGQPLQFTPGERRSYSNIGYLALGLLIEHATGQDLMTVIHERVLGPLGVSEHEYLQGATFAENQHPGEPHYHAPVLRVNVFDPAGPRVEHAYGGWDHEMRVGQGGHVATATALVTFLNHHFVAGPNIGAPIPSDAGSRWRWNHTGSLPGTSALARQRGDGISYAVVFNQRQTPDLAAQVRQLIDAELDAGNIDWDARTLSPRGRAGWGDGSVGVHVRQALRAEQGMLINNGMYAAMDTSLMARLGLEVGQKIEVSRGDRSAVYILHAPRHEGGDILRMGRAGRQRLGETETFSGRIAPVEAVRIERALFSMGLHDVVNNPHHAAVDADLMRRLGLNVGDRITLRAERNVEQSATFTVVEALDEGNNIVRIGLSGRQRLGQDESFSAYLSLAERVGQH